MNVLIHCMCINKCTGFEQTFEPILEVEDLDYDELVGTRSTTRIKSANPVSEVSIKCPLYVYICNTNFSSCSLNVHVLLVSSQLIIA